MSGGWAAAANPQPFWESDDGRTALGENGYRSVVELHNCCRCGCDVGEDWEEPLNLPVRDFTVCVLTYGDYTHLAHRCLSSIAATLSEGSRNVGDFRVGMNEVSQETLELVENWAEQVWSAYSIPTYLFHPSRNVFKYPLMRQMLHGRRWPRRRYVMWFDDDSFLLEQPDWWSRVDDAIATADMIGQTQWFRPLQGNQWEWIKLQPWFNPEVGLPQEVQGEPCIQYVQGAWWVIRHVILEQFDWPIKELRHNGGDSMLGELIRHQGLRMAEFNEGICPNASDDGVSTMAERRGYSEELLGFDFASGEQRNTDHQDFKIRVQIVGNAAG